MEMIQSSKKLDDLIMDLIKEGVLETQLKQIQLLLPTETFFDILSLYVTESEKTVNNLHHDLEPKKQEFGKAFEEAFRLKGGSLSIGAERVRYCCDAIMRNCRDKNIGECQLYLKQLAEERSLVVSKLEPVIAILQEIVTLDAIAEMEMKTRTNFALN